jgi:ABC-type arginine/histidine transport system permease subunit
MEKLRSLNRPVAKILAVHSGGREAKNADSDTAKEFTVSRSDTYQRIMLTANLPTVVFISFNNYEGPTITALDGTEVVPIVPIRRTKAKIDLGTKEFAAGLSFVAVSRVRALEDLLFSPFSFERLERIKSYHGDPKHVSRIGWQRD